MAINRLYLRCTICRGEVCIARLAALSDDTWTPARAEAVAEWPVFLREHGDCDPEGRRLHVELTSENDRGLVLNGGAR